MIATMSRHNNGASTDRDCATRDTANRPRRHGAVSIETKRAAARLHDNTRDPVGRFSGSARHVRLTYEHLATAHHSPERPDSRQHCSAFAHSAARGSPCRSAGHVELSPAVAASGGPARPTLARLGLRMLEPGVEADL